MFACVWQADKILLETIVDHKQTDEGMRGKLLTSATDFSIRESFIDEETNRTINGRIVLSCCDIVC